MSESFSSPLAGLLAGAARAVRDVLAGRSLTEALEGLPAAERPAVQAIAFHAMRGLGRARALRGQLVARAPSPAADALLLTALCLLDTALEAEAGGQPAGPRYASHTVVDQAVRAAAAGKALAPYKNLVNAVLRRYGRERDTLLHGLRDDPEARWNHPQWWVQALQAAYPERWRELLAAGNAHAPLVLRVNRRRAGRGQVVRALAQAGVGAAPVLDWGLVLDAPRPVAQLPGFAEGWWSVQDPGAQRAAPLLDVRDGMRVLDACAAPGGKTAHLLESADIELLALDADAGRLARVGQNLERLGLTGPGVALAAADAADPAAWWDGRPFDAVLADVPCTASGIVRRHPDIRWLRRRADVARAAALQRRIADALWTTVAPGGRMLYATCSIFPAECREQAEAFARRHPDAEALPADGQLLPSAGDAPPAAQHDGFFYALFAKRA